MIIGETNSNYDGYEESYDYLFKRKGAGPTPRQQKKAEKKASAPAKKPGRLAQKRQDRKAGIVPPKKRLIMGNFGLFNKNKKREEAAAKTSAAANIVVPPPEPEQLPEPETLDENTQSQEMNPGPGLQTPTTPEENPEGGMPEGAGSDETWESGYDEKLSGSTSDTKKNDKGGKSTSGAWIGWTFLGMTVAGIAFALYSLNNTSKDYAQSYNRNSLRD